MSSNDGQPSQRTNESARPVARATGPHLCSEAAAPRTIGRIGRTQGDRIDNTPARKARTTLPIVTAEVRSKGLIQQHRYGFAVRIPDRSRFLLRALERNQSRLRADAEAFE